MSYLLFTGATGLLGGYLLRDLLKCDARLAVVVRNSRMETARSRIESILARWEKILGYALPRPVVLSGDITRPSLDLNDAAVKWVAANCRGVLHNAASLSFEETADGEPHRSNVTGTKHLLELCRQTGLKEFFHVSTAYVSGLREGVIHEQELDVGQQPANPYEASKIQAEVMVRSASFLAKPTVFRPGIIVGDSISGYTTTFHGFYAPLKSVHALSTHLQRGVPEKEMMQVLGFSGGERKHFVPVDWISAVMTHVIRTPRHHHQTYHLTPDAPISVAQVTESMARSLSKYGAKPKVSADFALESLVNTKQQFQELLSAYRSYWRADPVFDKSNTNRVAAHLPCPELNAALLDRLCRFAIQANFGWPLPSPIKPAFDLAPLLDAGDFTVECQISGPVAIGLQVNGPGGGQWTVSAEEGSLNLVPGISRKAAAKLYLNSSSMRQLVDDPAKIEMAVSTGRLLIEGQKESFPMAIEVLRAIAANLISEKVLA